MLEQVKRILAIPAQKTDQRLVDHLTAEQYSAILEAPDPTTRLGIRDRTMLHLCVTAGLRVSELVDLRVDDATSESRYVHLHGRGKGRKDRRLTLWQSVAQSLRAWLAVRGAALVPEIFLNARGKEMTRAGVEYLLRKHVATAVKRCPSLQWKRVSPQLIASLRG